MVRTPRGSPVPPKRQPQPEELSLAADDELLDFELPCPELPPLLPELSDELLAPLPPLLLLAPPLED